MNGSSVLLAISVRALKKGELISKRQITRLIGAQVKI